ncbi:MAG: glycosyltransferase N-terminal domain-containing protein [Chitinophagales bacterium]
MSALAYNIGIQLYGLGIYIASLFNKKAALWIEGRKDWKTKLQPKSATTQKTAWFHCASLGEFEQARPLIEKLKQERPDYRIVLSFFSPSGYEVRKNYSGADVVTYLPLDTPQNAKQFIALIQPNVAFFVKYEFWYNYLSELKNKGIPTILFSAIFRKEQVFFAWYGGLFRQMLKMFTSIFVQTETSQKLLAGIGIKSVVANDTRFDRVYQIAQNRQQLPLIEKFKGTAPLLIAGSTWPKDEELLLQLIAQGILKGYKYIIAPHDIDSERIDKLTAQLGSKVVKLSQLNDGNAANAEVIVVDSIGQLTFIYAYGTIAYVGGGFNASVHNVLEPAVYGMPVIFGPNHQKSAEALQLIARGAGFCITDAASLNSIVASLLQNNKLPTSANAAKQYVAENPGGTAVIWNVVNTLL